MIKQKEQHKQKNHPYPAAGIEYVTETKRRKDE